MATDSVRCEIASGVATITIARQARRNALDNPALQQFIGHLERLRDVDISALVLTGEGLKAFCAGSDLKALSEYRVEEALLHTRLFLRCTELLDEQPCATIAAIEGFCFGGGLEIALACDARIASVQSLFGFPEITVGALPTGGGTVSAARAIGLARAREMLVFGERIDAATALSWGLISQTAEPGATLSAASEKARRYAERVGARSISLLKQILISGQGAPGQTGRALAYLADQQLIRTEAFKDGISMAAGSGRASAREAT
jgi:enoyl-CoA hydratase/carnithine racemase